MVDSSQRFTKFLLARDGATAMEFAYILPILFAVTLGIIELSLILFDYHRAGEAMRAAVRAFEIDPAITSYSNLPMTCPGGADCNTARIDSVIADLQATFPQIAATNLRIDYRESNVGIPGVDTPLITVSLVNLQHNFFILNSIIPGVPDSIPFADFSTTRMGPSRPSQ